MLLVAFGAVDEPLPSCMRVHFWACVCFLNDSWCVIPVWCRGFYFHYFCIIYCLGVFVHYLGFACYFSSLSLYIYICIYVYSEMTSFHSNYFVLAYSIDIVYSSLLIS